MIPVLHPADSTSWASFGLGALSDAVTCEVTEERNGQYELEMTYPVSGQHYADIAPAALPDLQDIETAQRHRHDKCPASLL